MIADELRRRSRWMMRALEWDEPRARYPNIWHERMPCHVMAFDSLACRLRLGDLIAVFHPAGRRHPERANRFLGLSRVAGLRRADRPDYRWIDLETAHRFDPPLDAGAPPRHVFLCCDSGWPEQDAALFRKVFDAAVAAGWEPDENERAPGRNGAPKQQEAGGDAGPVPGERANAAAEPATRKGSRPAGGDATPSALVARPAPSNGGRLFGGADYSGDMRDPRDGTWLALTELRGDALRVVRLEPTGRHGLQACLRNPDALLMKAEAIGLDFPFGVPLRFAERLLRGPFPEEGWWALARCLEKLSRPDYLVALQEYREAEGETRRWTDEKASAFSPLHRADPDLGPMTYHGIRMIAEERSRYALKPFENAQGRLLFEVYPGGLLRKLGVAAGRGRRLSIIEALRNLDQLPVAIAEPYLEPCRASCDALDAVIAARCAAAAVLSEETERRVEELAPEHPDRVRLEGWIYGLHEARTPPGTAS